MKSGNMIGVVFSLLAVTPVMAADWTGAYFGGQIGFLDYEDKTSIGAGAVPPGGTLYDGSGAQFGVYSGYLLDFGQLVLGGEAAFNLSSIELDLTPTGAPAPREVTQTREIKLRAGYDAGNMMPYALVGYAWQTVDLPAGDQDYDGMSYGIGLDYVLPSGLIAGAEILSYELENGTPGSSLETDSLAVNFRLSHRF